MVSINFQSLDAIKTANKKTQNFLKANLKILHKNVIDYSFMDIHPFLHKLMVGYSKVTCRYLKTIVSI